MAAGASKVATPGLTLWPARACLVTALADELAKAWSPDAQPATPADALARTHVVLPTKRLAQWLLALLTQRRAAFVPPVIYTFDQLVEAYGSALAPPDSPEPLPMSPLAQELLLASLLKARTYRHLAFGHAHEARQFFAELTGWGVREQAFAKMRAAILDNAYLSDGSLDTLSERVDELEDLLAAFTATLADHGLETVEWRSARLSRSVAAGLAQPLASLSLGAERLYVVGLTSTIGAHAALLAALGQRPDASLWLSDPQDTAGDQHQPPSRSTGVTLQARRPLDQLVGMIMGDAPVTRARHQVEGAIAVAEVRTLWVGRAASPTTEAALALSLARQAQSAGRPASAIAILVANEGLYGPILRGLLRQLEVEANVALAAPLVTTSLGIWLSALLALLNQPDDALTLVAFAQHPLTLGWWSAAAGAVIGPLDWRARLSSQLTAMAQGRGVQRDATEIRALLNGIDELLAPMITGGRGRQAQSLESWSRQLREVLDTVLAATPAADEPAAAEGRPSRKMDRGLATAARQAVLDFLATGDSLGGLDLQLTLTEFATLIRSRLLTGSGGDVRGVGDPLRGLQILGIAEARYVPFEVAIVVGAVEGDFPRGLPKDYLVDNYLKSRAGLPGWQLLEAIEDTTFQLLRARLPAMALLYPERRGDEEVVRSRFVETVLAGGGAEWLTTDGDQSFQGLVAPPALAPGSGPSRRGEPLGRLPPETDLPALALSASAGELQELIACPYRFLLSRLGVKGVDLPREAERAFDGQWLHGVLEAFFTGRVGSRVVAPPLVNEAGRGGHRSEAPLPSDRRLWPFDRLRQDAGLEASHWNQDWEAFESYAMGRLEALTERLGQDEQGPALTDIQLFHYAWPRFVGFLRTTFAAAGIQQLLKGQFELRLAAATGQPPTIQAGPYTITLRAKVDAVLSLEDGTHIIIDYKLGTPPPRAQVRRGLVPQLPAYGIGLSAARALTGAGTSQDGAAKELEQLIIGYWSLLKGNWTYVASGAAIDPGARPTLVPKQGRHLHGLEEVVAQLNGHLAWRLEEILDSQGAFAPDPSSCGSCGFSGVCRRDDPEYAAQLLKARRLGTRLNNLTTAVATANAPAAAAPTDETAHD